MADKPDCAFCGEPYLPHDRTWQQWQCAACTNWNDHTEATVDDWEDEASSTPHQLLGQDW